MSSLVQYKKYYTIKVAHSTLLKINFKKGPTRDFRYSPVSMLKFLGHVDFLYKTGLLSVLPAHKGCCEGLVEMKYPVMCFKSLVTPGDKTILA